MTDSGPCVTRKDMDVNVYRRRKMKRFEALVRTMGWEGSVWVEYAQWEESQKFFNRARPVWERSLKIKNFRNHRLWLKYIDFEVRNNFINRARNVCKRAVTHLPRIDRLWFNYINVEEIVCGNEAGTRQIFEKWMKLEPDQLGWKFYISFELSYNEIERARDVYERFVKCHPEVSVWISFAKFETVNGGIARARNCNERAVEILLDKEEDLEDLFVEFAEFEDKCNETERARCIYKFALDNIRIIGRAQGGLYSKFVAFEKEHGNDKEDPIVGKRRFHYEDEVKKNHLNYNSWFDYILGWRSVSATKSALGRCTREP